MFDPSQVTLGQASGFVRDLSVVATVIIASWKGRGIFETAKNFFERIELHMDTMELFAKTVMTNHLKHIEADLKTLSGRKDDDLGEG
jgi:hypothetical protein